MIASPGDVAQARRIIRDVVDEWNAVNAEDREIILMPLGWETHASPQMGDRPQGIINGQLLKDTDLLIAFFGLGSVARRESLQAARSKRSKNTWRLGSRR
jgi:hypothetical protein